MDYSRTKRGHEHSLKLWFAGAPAPSPLSWKAVVENLLDGPVDLPVDNPVDNIVDKFVDGSLGVVLLDPAAYWMSYRHPVRRRLAGVSRKTSGQSFFGPTVSFTRQFTRKNAVFRVTPPAGIHMVPW